MSDSFFRDHIINRGVRLESDPDVLLLYFRTLKGIILNLGMCGDLVAIILEKITDDWESDLKAISYDCIYYACKLGGDNNFISSHNQSPKLNEMLLCSLLGSHYLERLCALRLFVHLYFKNGSSMDYSRDQRVKLIVKFCSDEDHRVRKVNKDQLEKHGSIISFLDGP